MWKSVGPVGTNIVAYLFPIRKNRNSNTHWKLSRRTPPIFLVHQGYWKPRNQLACRFRSPIKPSLSSSYSYSATTRTGLPRGKLTDLKNVNWEQWAGFSSLWHEYTPVLSTPLRHIYTLRIELLEIQSLTAANCYDFQEQDYHLLFYWSTLFPSGPAGSSPLPLQREAHWSAVRFRNVCKSVTKKCKERCRKNVLFTVEFQKTCSAVWG